MDVPQPHAKANTFVVRVRAAGICGTDLHTYHTGIFREVSIPVDGGVLIGHEFSGDVAEVGQNVKGVKAGDRVTAIGFGAYAEYVVGDIRWGFDPVKLPEHLSDEEAATNEPLAVALHAVNQGDPQPTDTVLIIGAGMIGLSCLQVIRALRPVKQVIVADRSEKRLAMARELGADLVINVGKEDLIQKMLELTGSAYVVYCPRPTAHVDVVFECAGAPETPQQAVEVVTPVTGRVVLVGAFERPPQLDLNFPVSKNTRILGMLGWTNEEFAQSVDLMAGGKVNRKPLITHRFPLDQVQEAFETQEKTDECIKVLVQP